MRNLELPGRSPVHAPGGIDKPPLLVLAKIRDFSAYFFGIKVFADKVRFTEGERKISQSSAVYIPRSSYNLVRSSLGAPAFVGTAHFRAWCPAE